MTFYLRSPEDYPEWRDADRATRVQILRARAGMTQVQVARRAGVARRTVQLAETDPSCQMIDTVERILDALGATLTDLLAAEPPWR